MNNNLVESAYFMQKNADDSKAFYLECFKKLKTELDFDFGIILYKKGNRFLENYRIAFDNRFENYGFDLNKKQKGINRLKIPVKMQENIIGYFVLEKFSPFSKLEKQKAEAVSKIYADKIKDFEISKIFKNQLLILQDAIIEKNTAAKKLEEQNEKLIETDKIRSEFLANVSHELRTPLNSIIGFSTALKDGAAGVLNEKQKGYTNKILSSAIHLTGLINDILDMTKIEAGAMKLSLRPNNPTEIIKEVINIIESLAVEKNIKIETDFKFKGEILIDCAKFRQIMYNITGNAIKFSHKNSKIIISTKKVKNEAHISVQDFGVGIEKKNLEKIFEKFVQLDNIYTKTYSSTGLGLTITSELVKLHNGRISIKSELKKGSTFTLKFKIN